ncbi:MAG TPA: ABC transporter permease [Acidimicrobiales bacterium]|nr:ABC transporter permease [Acidimicrobiales bacterium]
MSGTTFAPPVLKGAPQPVGPGNQRAQRLLSGLRQTALIPVIVLLIIIGRVINPAFLSLNNFTEIGQFSSAQGLTVVGESLVLLTGGIDISLESTYGLAPMVAAWTILSTNLYGAGIMLNPYLALLVLLAVGAGVGMTNGLLIVKGRLNAFMVTLAMTIALYGLQDGVVHDQSLFNLPRPFTYLGATYLFSSSDGTGGIPVSLIFCVAVFVGVGLFLRYHRVGRAIYAVGGNREAARAAGIKVDRVRIGVYVAAGVLAAIGGLMEAGQTSQVSTLQGYPEGIIFPVFAAAVIGGVSLQGGRGNMLGAATGVALLGIVQNILNISQVSEYWVFAVDGAVILAALILARVIGGRAAAE